MHIFVCWDMKRSSVGGVSFGPTQVGMLSEELASWTLLVQISGSGKV